MDTGRSAGPTGGRGRSPSVAGNSAATGDRSTTPSPSRPSTTPRGLTPSGRRRWPVALIENGTTLGTVLDTGSWCPAAGELSATAGRCAHAARRPALATLDGEVLVVEH